MDQLPFLVVHGGLMWKVALCVTVFGTPLAIWVLDCRKSRRHAQREHVRLGCPTDSVDSFAPTQVVTVKGRLIADGSVSELASEAAAVTRYQRYVEIQSEQAGSLQLDVQGETVAIAGPVSVRVGSRHWPHRSFYAGLRQHTNALYSGDLIVARGRAQPKAAAAAATTDGYRTATSAWTLEPDGESVVLAGAGVPRTVAPTFGWHMSRGLIGGALFLIALVSVGKFAYSTHGYTLAAASPLHRDAALEKLTPDFYIDSPMTQREIERVGALLVLRNRCESAVDLLYGTRRYRQVIEWAADCDDDSARDQAAEAAAQLVDYELSSDLYVANQSHHEQAVLVHIVAGRWDRAHGAVARMASEYEATEAYQRAREYGDYSAERDLKLRHSAHEYDVGLDCLVHGLAVRAGDSEGLARLRDLASKGGEMCTLVLAELLPRKERLEYLQRHPRDDNASFSLVTVRGVLAESSEARDGMDRSIIPDTLHPPDVLALPSIERSLAALDARDTSLEARVKRANVALSAAGAAALAHQWKRAIALLESSMAEFGYKSPYTDRHQAALAAVRFRQGDIAQARGASETVAPLGSTVRMLIALHDRDLSALEPRTELGWRYGDWRTDIKRALGGDTAGLKSRVFEHAGYSVSRFARKAALFGPLLPRRDQRHLVGLLAHRSEIAYAQPDRMFAIDSLIEFAADRLGATELANVYRDRLARRYEVLRNPDHGTFLMLVAAL